MNDNPIYAAFADDVRNTCAFCSYLEYIADSKQHFCMRWKVVLLPEQPACQGFASILKNSAKN